MQNDHGEVVEIKVTRKEINDVFPTTLNEATSFVAAKAIAEHKNKELVIIDNGTLNIDTMTYTFYAKKRVM